MQIDINGKRNITLDFNAPKKFRLVKDGAEIPYIRTGKNSFRLSKPVDGFVELEEIVEQPRYMQPVQLQPQQMTVINPQDVDRLNEAVRQMALVNPQDVMIINQTAEQLEKNQNFIAQTQKEITDNQIYIDQQQQRLNETALGIQSLETNNSQRLDGAENAILNLAGEISNTQNMAVDGMNTALNKIEEQGILLQAEIDTKANKEELETLRKDFEEKSDQFSNAMSSYSGGFAYDTLPQNGEAGQILAKRTDRQGDYIWIDQTPVIVKSETMPTASEKYKGEVYQYVGETGDYTHGYIYECQQNGTSYNWVRLDVQPNHSTEIESLTTRVGNLETDKQDKLTQTQMDAVNSGANQSNIAQITTNQTNINTINSKIPAQASSSNQLADKSYVDTADNILQTAINSKQDAISDLSTIRSGANAGATAVQPGNLSTVATTGAYSDLIGTPIIPVVNNAVLTITQNGTSVGTFTANANSNITIATTDTTYSNFTGADGTNAGTTGLVPAPSATDNAKFLKGDGTWDIPTAQASFANITGQPSDNTNLATALNDKASKDLSNITSTAQENLVDLLFPVGSCYTTTANTCPLASIKGTWVEETCRILVGRKAARDNDQSWWNLYSDGWCEQGGVESSGSTTVVTLPKAFRDLNYTVQSLYIGTTAPGYAMIVENTSTSTFTLKTSGGSANRDKNWQACGYTSTTTGHKRFRRTA